ncbi:uncharacterized protein LOC105689084 [Athalia rosae]|uniref:uncharacterized protein LOC105689084 n=1 Tax=Athalia rosae TaxID=37344 RepID=UPI0020344CAD|nr:uncharacterized protein LOC105689084 [Athalia rosae]
MIPTTNVITILVLSSTCCSGIPLSGIWLSPIAPVAPLSQYHTHDGSGGYHYAYAGPHHSKVETRLGGLTRGGYSYIDANGVLQTVAYTADDLNGFRVQASNLPQQSNADLIPVEDTAEVSAAKKSHSEELKRAEAIGSGDEIPQTFLEYSGVNSPGSVADSTNNNKLTDTDRSDLSEGSSPPVSQNLFSQTKTEGDQLSEDIGGSKLSSETSNLPAKVSTSGYVILRDGVRGPQTSGGHDIQEFSHLATAGIPHYVFPILPYRLMHSSLHHTQDSLGQYDYTYAGDTSAKTESRSLDGTTRGAYSYIDANGLLQQVHYVADHNGFRVAATNLPEAK